MSRVPVFGAVAFCLCGASVSVRSKSLGDEEEERKGLGHAVVLQSCEMRRGGFVQGEEGWKDQRPHEKGWRMARRPGTR